MIPSGLYALPVVRRFIGVLTVVVGLSLLDGCMLGRGSWVHVS